jgi:hypothetical protein
MVVNVEHHVKCKDILAPTAAALELHTPCVEQWHMQCDLPACDMLLWGFSTFLEYGDQRR